MKFKRCESGNIIMPVEERLGSECINDGLIVPNSTNADPSKHIPVVSVNGNRVDVVVGEVIHPMIPEHYIMWIGLETTKGFYLRYLNPMDEPKATFVLSDNEEMVEVYEYCNLHGLWVYKQ